jgi:hypothetical protein
MPVFHSVSIALKQTKTIRPYYSSLNQNNKVVDSLLWLVVANICFIVICLMNVELMKPLVPSGLFCVNIATLLVLSHLYDHYDKNQTIQFFLTNKIINQINKMVYKINNKYAKLILNNMTKHDNQYGLGHITIEEKIEKLLFHLSRPYCNKQMMQCVLKLDNNIIKLIDADIHSHPSSTDYISDVCFELIHEELDKAEKDILNIKKQSNEDMKNQKNQYKEKLKMTIISD